MARKRDHMARRGSNMVKKLIIIISLLMAAGTPYAAEFDANSDDVFDDAYKFDVDNLYDGGAGLSANVLSILKASDYSAIETLMGIGTLSALAAGTMTDGYYCTYSTSTGGIVCNTSSGGVDKTIQTSSADDAGTITPTTGYDFVHIRWSPTSDPSAISIGETGATNGTVVRIENVGTNTGTIAYSSGVFEHKGGAGTSITLEPGDFIEMEYFTDKYIVTNNHSSSIFFSYISTPLYGVTDADGRTLTSSEMNGIVTSTGAGDIDIPADLCDTVSATGARIWMQLQNFSGSTVALTSNDTLDQFCYIATGAFTCLTAGNEMDLADDAIVTVMCSEANKWYVIGQTGTVSDGGTAD